MGKYIFISFYQVIRTLQDVYGVQIDDELKSWFGFLNVFNLDIVTFSIPSSCVGSMSLRLILLAT